MENIIKNSFGIFNGPKSKNTKYWTIKAKSQDEAEIFIYGDIGEGFWSEGVGAKQFAKDLKALGDVKKITLRINSPGGSVFEGLAIYNQLKAHKAEKEVYIDGLAASIASVIAMSGDKIHMPENAMMMIHDPSGLVMGSAEDMRKMAAALDKIKDGLVTAYRRSGKTDEEIGQMMTDETWMSAEEACEMGFCDETITAMKVAAHFDLSTFKNVPASVLVSHIANRSKISNEKKPEECNKKEGDKECEDCPMSADECERKKQMNQAGAIAGATKLKEVITMKCRHCGKDFVNGVCPDKCEDKHLSNAVDAETNRVSEIMALGQKQKCLDKALEAVKNKVSADQFRKEILDSMEPAKPLKVGSVTSAATEKPFSSIGDQLMVVANQARGKASSGDIARLMHISNAATGASESVPADGSFLIQQDFTLSLLPSIEDNSVLYKKTRNIPIGPNANGLRAPILDETTRATGSRFGGVTVYRTAEAPDLSTLGSKPKFALLDLRLEDFYGVCFATEDLLQDAVALGAIIQTAFPAEMGFVLDDEIIRGTGAGRMLGILSSAALVSVTKETGQAAATIETDNIVKMVARMPGRLFATAEWYINQDCLPQIYTLMLGNYPIYMPPGGASSTPYGTLYGKPLNVIEQADTLGQKGDILLFDLSQYITIDKGGIDSQESIHVKFLTDERCFRFKMRNNGQPAWKASKTPYKGSNKVSPFISLDARE